MSQDASSSLLNQASSSLIGNTTGDNIDFLVRRGDNDDVDHLKGIVTDEVVRDGQDALYNYPDVLHLFENCFISVTILDRNQRIIGCASFNDFPQGLRGKHDFKHENCWEDWLPRACNLLDKPISPRNSLWLVYFFVAPEFKKDQVTILERVFQNIYNDQNQLACILFLKRGEAVRTEATALVEPWLKEIFIELEVVDKGELKKLVGISSESEFYYSAKSMVVEHMEIRMARE
jgi:hypothetical protein